MHRFNFKRGMKVMAGTREWHLERRTPTGQLCFEDGNAEMMTCTASEFYQNYLSRKWSVVKEQLFEQVPLQERAPRDLQTFAEAHRRKAEWKLSYLKPLLEQNRVITTPDKIRPIIEKTARQLDDKNIPSVSTVLRWYRRYRNGNSMVALVDRAEDRGRRVSFDYAIQEIVFKAVDQVYLNQQKYPAKMVFKTIKGEIANLNKTRVDEAQIKCPSRAKVYRYLNSLNIYETQVKRLGREAADKNFGKVLAVHKTDRIMERWEIDHTPLNIIVVDRVGNETVTIGKPWLSVVIDKHSRMVMGFYISFAPPSTEAMMSCLKMAILPKEEFLSRFSSIRHDWPVFGLPEMLVCDNGMEFHSHALKQACLEMVVQLLFCPSKSPQYKGTVERFLRTIAEGIIHLLPGTVFSNPKQRGNYHSEKLASIEFPLLLEIVTKWIVDVYSHTVHSALGKTPYQAWQESLQNRTPIELPSDPQQLEIILGIPAARVLSRHGIEVNRMRYNSDELHRLFQFKGGIEVNLKYYEHEIGYIHVFDPETKEYLRVPAIDDRAFGRTYAQHKALNDMLRDRKEAGQSELWDDEVMLLEMSRSASSSKKMGKRKQGVVLRSVSSGNPLGIEIKPTNSRKERSQPTLATNNKAIPQLEVSPNMARKRQKELWGGDHE